jgi:hypothetical protein
MAAPLPLQQLSRDALLDAEGELDSEKLIGMLNQQEGATYRALASGLTFTENFQASLKTVRLVMPSEASVWTEIGAADAPTFEGAWGNLSASWTSTAFYIAPGGMVHLKGVASGGAVPGNVYRLPVGYRPRRTLLADAISNNLQGRFDIQSDGYVRATVGNTAWISMDLMSFQATAPAAPKPFASAGWPIIVRHDLPKCVGVMPVACRIVNGAVNEAVGNFYLDWEDKGDGQLKLKAAWGLQWDKVYSLTFLAFAG